MVWKYVIVAVMLFDRIIETLCCVRLAVVPKWGDYCSETVVCTFVLMEEGGMGCQCVLVKS
jgi:hypothetical protein